MKKNPLIRLSHNVMKLSVLVSRYILIDEHEKYDTFSDFKKLCYHIKEYIVCVHRAKVLHKTSVDYPRKKKKQMRKEELLVFAELPNSKCKIESMLPYACKTTKDEAMTSLINIMTLAYECHDTEGFNYIRLMVKTICKENDIPSGELIDKYKEEINRDFDKLMPKYCTEEE